MTEPQRRAWRQAMRLHSAYVRTQQEQATPVLPVWIWKECENAVRWLTVAASRGWSGAVREQRSNLWGALRRLQVHCSPLLEVLSDARPDEQVPTLRDLYEELLALRQEFPDYECDPQQHTLTVETDEIDMDNIHLGSFQIVLHWERLADETPYDIVAVAPHPAESNSEVVHPHVSQRKLCEGDGKMPIQRALAAGRLVDFFQIVNGIQHTYND